MAVLMIKRLVGTLMGHLRRCAAPYARSSKQEHEPENLADLALEIFGPERGVDLNPYLEDISFGIGEPPDFKAKSSSSQ